MNHNPGAGFAELRNSSDNGNILEIKASLLHGCVPNSDVSLALSKLFWPQKCCLDIWSYLAAILSISSTTETNANILYYLGLYIYIYFKLIIPHILTRNGNRYPHLLPL